MPGEVLAVAIGLGLLISAILYFVFVWPAHEPPEND